MKNILQLLKRFSANPYLSLPRARFAFRRRAYGGLHLWYNWFIDEHNAMPDERLLKFIKDGFAQGRTEEILIPLLLSSGWAQKDIDGAFAYLKNPAVITPPAAAISAKGAAISPPQSVQPAQPVQSSQPASPVQSERPEPPVQPVTTVSAAAVTAVATPSADIAEQGRNNHNPFSAHGRLSRLSYLVTQVIIGVVPIALPFFALLAFLGVSGFLILLFGALVIGVLVIVFSTIASIKRFHDLGRPWWWVVGTIIPVYNFYLIIELFFKRGTEGANRYGADPLPAKEDHHDIFDKLGNNTIFKIVVAIVLSAAYIAPTVFFGSVFQPSNNALFQNKNMSGYSGSAAAIPGAATSSGAASAVATSSVPKNGGTTITLLSPSNNTYGPLEFNVSLVYFGGVDMTVTDHATGKSAKVTLTTANTATVLGYTMDLVSTQQVYVKNSLGQMTSHNVATLTYYK